MSDRAKQGDTTTDFVAEAIPVGKYLVNPYEDWARGESVPVHTGRAIDLMAVETQPWARFDCRGAIAHVDGRCDFLTVFVHEIAPGKAAAPQRHVYDELNVVLSGAGETVVTDPDGTTVTAFWGPGSLIGTPTNVRYRHRNTGAEPARLACFNDVRYLLSLYRNERFIFENPTPAFPLAMAVTRKTGSADAGPLVLGKSTIGADLVELPTTMRDVEHGVGPGGSETTARRQMQGAHLIGLDGEGFTRSWREGAEATATETRWRHGVVVGIPGMHFHRHSAVGPGPARALDVQLGSALFPMTRSRRHHYGDKSVYASGSAEIE